MRPTLFGAGEGSNMPGWNLITAWIILILGSIMLVVCSYRLAKHPKKWPIILPIWFWAFHLTVFYTFIVVGKYQPDYALEPAIINIWSTIQRLHGVITMYFVVYLLELRHSNG